MTLWSLLALPPMAEIGPSGPLPATVRDAFHALLAQAGSSDDEDVRRKLARAGADFADKCFAVLDDPAPVLARPRPWLAFLESSEDRKLARARDAFLARPELELAHVFRWLALIEDPHEWEADGLIGLIAEKVLPLLARRGSLLGLRELEAAAKAAGMKTGALGAARFDLEWGDDFALGIERLWPYYSENPAWLERALGIGGKTYREWPPAGAVGRRMAALEILAALPTPPKPWLERIWQLALADRHEDRFAAREYLKERVAIEPRRLEALVSPSKEEKRGAADWLGREKRAEFVAPLETALVAEKEPGVRRALCAALTRLGAPPRLGADYAHLRDLALAKAGKASWLDRLEFFPLAELPPLVRANGEEGEHAIGPLLVLEALDGKSPQPSLELEAYLELFTADSRADFALYVLEFFLRSPLALKNRHQGLLALVAAGGDDRVPQAAEPYIWKSSGLLTDRVRALVQMLTFLGSAEAIALLSTLSSRMKTATIRKEANEGLLLLADERGWTREDLVDALIPRLGFDTARRLRLASGTQVQLREDLEIEAPTSGDRPRTPSESAELKKLGKELAKVWEAQRLRLDEAMVSARAWPAEKWQSSLLRHPIVGLACRRLVFLASWDGGKLAFRPSAGGELLGAEDEILNLPASSTVLLAHGLDLEEPEIEAWRRHFARHRLTLLLDPLRPPKLLQPGSSDLVAIEPAEAGPEVPRKKLEAYLAPKGYIRGPLYDQGDLYRYVRTLPSAGLSAFIEVCGMSDEANPRLTLRLACFARNAARSATAEGYEIPRLRLAEVPPRLLSETWNDLLEARNLARK